MKRAIILLIVVAVLLAWVVWGKFRHEEPQGDFTTEIARFEHESLGAEKTEGIAFWAWMILPRMFPDRLPGPGGYVSLGLPWKQGEELPVGFSLKTVGYPRVTHTCALCHTATYRTDEEARPVYVAGGPAHTSNVQGYLLFLAGAMGDERFNAGAFLDELQYSYDLPWLDKQIYRYWIIPSVKRNLAGTTGGLAGSVDTGAEVSAGRINWMDMLKHAARPDVGTDANGVADFPSIWNLRLRESGPLLWDGSGTSLRSVVIDSAIVLGAPADGTLPAKIDAIDAWLGNLRPPAFPFPIDATLSLKGSDLYRQRCASCHESGSERAGHVIDIQEVGTDRVRLDAWAQAVIEAVNAGMRDKDVGRDDLVKTNGYVAPHLDGIWLRAPYLHNGSVPSLVELLKPESERIRTFVRGYDVYDPANVGFVIAGAGAERAGHRFDTSDTGNGNHGHLYGVDLLPEEKAALVEYLKTK